MRERTSTATRIWPKRGFKLDISAIRGQWMTSGRVDCTGVFAVIWQTPSGRYCWAALHDFDNVTRNHLIEECARADRGGVD